MSECLYANAAKGCDQNNEGAVVASTVRELLMALRLGLDVLFE